MCSRPGCGAGGQRARSSRRPWLASSRAGAWGGGRALRRLKLDACVFQVCTSRTCKTGPKPSSAGTGLGSGDGQALGQQSVGVLQQQIVFDLASGQLQQKTSVAGPGLLLLFRPIPFPQPLPPQRAGLSPAEPRVLGVLPRPAPGMSLHLIF